MVDGEFNGIRFVNFRFMGPSLGTPGRVSFTRAHVRLHAVLHWRALHSTPCPLTLRPLPGRAHRVPTIDRRKNELVRCEQLTKVINMIFCACAHDPGEYIEVLACAPPLAARHLPA